MVPAKPTAHPRLVSAKATPASSALVPELCVDHVVPPSRVVTMAPAFPTAHPGMGSGKATSSRNVLRSRADGPTRHGPKAGRVVAVTLIVVGVEAGRVAEGGAMVVAGT